MSNCSNHRRDLFGQTDMQHVAEEIGNLHYEALSQLLWHLATKLKRDAALDLLAGRKKISISLSKAAAYINHTWIYIREAWQISKPFMEENPQTENK